MATTEKASKQPDKEASTHTDTHSTTPPAHEPVSSSFEQTAPGGRQRYSLSLSRNALIVAAIVVGLGLSFLAGMQYQKSHAITMVGGMRTGDFNMDGSRGMGMGGRYGTRMGGVGTVTAISSSSITITLRSFGPDSSSSGTSKTYTINDSTKVVVDGSTGSVSSIKTGDTVFIRTSGSSSTAATEIRVGDMAAPPAPSGTTQTDNSSSSDTSTI